MMSSKGKKLILLVVILVIIAAIISILFYNRSKIESRAKTSEIETSIPVKTIKISYQNLEENLSLIGTIYAASEVNILSEVNGKVLEIYADAGDHIAKGAAILKTDDELKKAALMNAEANFAKTKTDLDRYEQLVKEKSATEAQLDASRLAFKVAESQLIIARRQLSDTKIVSPISGIITTRSAEVGTLLAPGTPVAYIVDISDLKIKVNVAEKDVFKLKIGDNTTIKTSVYNGIIFTGKIKSIAAKADDAHTYMVEITLKNSKEYPLKAGMFTNIEFANVSKVKSLVMPRTALIGSVKNPQAFIIQSGIARLKSVVIGDEIGNMLQVVQGLNEGDEVVINGQVNLKDSVEVRIIND